MVFMARDFDFCRGRYARFSVQWSDQKSIRDLVSSILRGPPNFAQIELGYEPYMLGKPWMSSFQQFLQFANPTSVERDMPVLVFDGQIRNLYAIWFLQYCGGHQILLRLN